MSNVNLTFNITTPDAASFRRSQQQLLAMAQLRLVMAGGTREGIRPSLMKRLGRMLAKVLAGKEDWK